MAVENVSNSSNNAGLYALGAGAVAGVGAGVYGYNSKPYLKDNNFSDTFVKKVGNQITLEQSLPKEEKRILKDVLKLIDEIDNTKNADELKNVFKNFSELLEECHPNESYIVDFYVDKVDEEGFESVKKRFLKLPEAIIAKECEMPKPLIDSCFDKSKNLKFDENEVSKEGFEVVKKAVKDMNMKAAGIWGGIAAAIAGLGTYLLTNNNKKS